MSEGAEHDKHCAGCQILGLMAERDALLLDNPASQETTTGEKP